MNETFPVLYILMRTDLTSMNAGKAMAQASHASNAFVYGELQRWMAHPVKTGWEKFKMFFGLKVFVDDDFLKWVNETKQGFGTVLVLAVNESQMRFTTTAAQKYGLMADFVHDPTYPLRDGDTTHFLPLDTCAYVFADKNDPITGMLLGGYKLHP